MYAMGFAPISDVIGISINVCRGLPSREQPYLEMKLVYLLKDHAYKTMSYSLLL